MRYNIKALIQHDDGDYWVRINNKELPYVDEDIVLAIKERNKEIERLQNIIEKNKYTADELNEIERLNNIINEFEKWLRDKIDSWKDDGNVSDNIYHERLAIRMIYYYFLELKDKDMNFIELKDSDKE